MDSIKTPVCYNIACANCYERECMLGNNTVKQCQYCLSSDTLKKQVSVKTQGK